MNKPDFGVIVGRFQVPELHEAHLELLRAIRSRHNRVIVVVGVSPVGATKRDPLDFETRRAMINAKFPEFTVLPLKDMKYDDVWSRKLDELISSVVDWGDVTLYGGRESFIKYYSGRYTPVELNLTIPLPVSGTQIRATITNSVMESPEFRAGVIYAVNNRRDESKGTADIAIIHRGEGGPYVLLGKRETEKAWRFVGGFADPVTEPENATVPPVFNGFDVDAKREAFEETGTDVNSLEYIGSTQVMDWRYRKLDSKIKTVFFLAESMTMAPTDGRDDIKDAKWFNVKDLNIDMFEAAHKPLYAMFMKHLEKRGY